MNRKFLGMNLVEWFFFIIIALLIKMNYITFAEGMIINAVAIGLEMILKELKRIREILINLQVPPFHINCRHQISNIFTDEEEK